MGLTQPLTEMTTRNVCGWLRAAGAYGSETHRHMLTECPEIVGSSTSENPTDLHDQLQR
jgi:hypothetical protein